MSGYRLLPGLPAAPDSMAMSQTFIPEFRYTAARVVELIALFEAADTDP